MLENGTERGFSEYELNQLWDQEIIGQDEEGYYVFTAYENAKVYFEDYYELLEKIEIKSLNMIESTNWSMSQEENKDKLTRLYAEKFILLRITDLTRNHYGHYQGLELISSPKAFREYAVWSIESIEEIIPQDRLQGNQDALEVLAKVKDIYQDVLGEIMEEFVEDDQETEGQEGDEQKDEQYFNQMYYE